MSQRNRNKKKIEVEQTPEEKLRDEVIEGYTKAHGTPVTRREMLASGVIPFAASMVMPTWLKLFSRAGVAQAQDLVCSSAAGGDLPAFFQLKLNGGAAMSYNFFPLGMGGAMPDASKYGGKGPALLNNFANSAAFTTSSGFYAGLISVASQATLMKTVFGGIPCVIGDDSQTQKLALGAAAAESGLKGKLIQYTATTDTSTGLSATAAVSPGTEAPLIIAREEDIVGSLGVSGALSVLSSAQKTKLFNTIQNLTAGQVQAISGLNGAQTLSQLMQCANINNSSLIGNTGALNISPLTNQAFATIWGVNANTSTSSQAFVFATLAQNAINGNCGPAGMSIGGYDYHGNAKAATDQKDNDAGKVVGQLLESLALSNKAGFITICSDGAVTSQASDVPGAPWASDGGGTSCIYMLYYDPTGMAKATGSQIGYMGLGGRADDTFVTGGDPEKASAAVLYNYLILAYGLAGGDTKFTQVSKSVAFSAADKAAISLFYKG